MSYKIANANAAIEHSGLLNPSKFKNSKVVLSGTPPAGSGYTSGQKFTIGPIKTIGLVDVFTLTGSSNLGILYDEYVHGSTIKVYSINGEVLSQLCEGVI
jgi:hypothetical protein